MSEDPRLTRDAGSSSGGARRPFRPPALRTEALHPASALLACSPGFPVDCYPLDGIHHCVKNACGCYNKPPHC